MTIKTNPFKKYLKLVTTTALAGTISVILTNTGLAETLQKIEIKGEKAGELILAKDDLALTPWQSSNLSGKARTIMHMAGRKSSRQMQDEFITALKSAKFDAQYYQTTSIVDLSDAIWGTSSFVESMLEKNKRNFPWSSVVLDREGQFRAAHDLSEKSSAVYVLDAKGDVIFSQEGSLSPQDIEKVLSLLKNEIKRIKDQETNQG